MIKAFDIDIKIDIVIYRYIDFDIVPQGEFPWMVAILDSSKQLACGGTLVDEWVVLVLNQSKDIRSLPDIFFWIPDGGSLCGELFRLLSDRQGGRVGCHQHHGHRGVYIFVV